ncbi:MAG: gluconokinase [Nocardioidaceae bacterium]
MPGSRRRTLHIVVMGVSATGKTTVGEGLAEELGCEFVEGDELHPSANIKKMSDGIPLTDEDRWPWLQAIAELVAVRDHEGTSTVVTCSALKKSYRDVLRDAAPTFFVHLEAPFEVLQERMSHRTKHFMPTTLLQSQFDTLEPLEDDEAGAAIDVSPPIDEVIEEAVNAVRVHYTE